MVQQFERILYILLIEGRVPASLPFFFSLAPPPPTKLFVTELRHCRKVLFLRCSIYDKPFSEFSE